ncbi:MAG: GNAT family N-acetyltransferase [Nitrospiraceae bacterium]|nr:GNAT family N-acetyltransferase [Nitrospiraceae bacterium]MDA8388823.1 GNAT family N-acetyltransferase [Nitrospiraceae bacterium]
MIIKKIVPDSHSKSNGSSAPYDSVFDTPQWTGLFGEKTTHYGLYDASGALTGRFYIYRERRYGLSVCCNPPLTPTIGPFFRNDAQNPVRAMDKCKLIMSHIAEYIDKMNYSVVSLSFDKSIIDMQPFIWRDFKVVPQYTYVMELALPVDDIWRRMSYEKRNHITRGVKDGLAVRQINDYSVVKALVLKTFSRQKKTISESGMNKVLFDFANDANSFAFAAFHHGNPIACSFCVRDNKTAYYLLGGYDSENKHHAAGPLCVWESIRHAKSLGLPHFDFEGSMVPAIEQYFRGFGGRLTPYYRVNKAKLPLEIALKFFKRGLF